MKTSILKNNSLPVLSAIAISFCLAFPNLDIHAQEIQAQYIQSSDSPNSSTLFGPDTQVSFVWSPEMKVSTIQNETGTALGFYAGALINRSFLIAGAFGASGDYQTNNYCYFGIMGQYTYKPHKLVHPSAQLLIAAGSTLDYDNEWPNVFDDDLKNGAPFYFAEPGLNMEVNLGRKVRFVTGLSYRFAWGLNEYPNDYVSQTHLTSKDMSGISCNFGLKFGLY